MRHPPVRLIPDLVQLRLIERSVRCTRTYTHGMSTLEFRRPRPDELREFLGVSVRSYGSHDGDDRLDWELLSNEVDRSYGALADGRWVAGSGAFSLEVTLPGGVALPAAGVTMVGVEPTHRRRGILTRMLRQLHGDACDRNEPLAVLTASETSIYRRFGYGIGGDVAHSVIDTDSVVLDPPVSDEGSFKMIDLNTHGATLASIHDRARLRHTGWVSLTKGMWNQMVADPDFIHDGRTPLRGVIHYDPAGLPDGYATWRIENRSESDRLAGNTLHLEHLTATGPAVEAALWTFVASIDLVKTIEWIAGPPDPPLRWRLVEPRRLRTTAVADMTWIRLLDVPVVLSSRHYGGKGQLTLDVTDRFHPERGGVFLLSTSDGCERIDLPASEADLHLDTADLASLVMGAVSPSQLRSAGRLTATTDQTVRLADAMFMTSSRPWCPIDF